MANKGAPEAPPQTSIDNDSSAIHKFKRVYLKDLSFESPNVPEIFTAVTSKEHQIKINVRVAHTALENDDYEVRIRLTLHAIDSDQNTICLIEVEQAGLFNFSGMAKQDLEPYLKIHCPRALYPFARRHIWSLISDGSFPPLLVDDFDFEVMHKIAAGT